jgi:hypothetical protein
MYIWTRDFNGAAPREIHAFGAMFEDVALGDQDFGYMSNVVANNAGRMLTFYPKQVTGRLQVVKTGAGANFSLTLRGRVSPVAPWTTLTTKTQADIAGGSIIVDPVVLMPECQLICNSLDTSLSLDAWVTELE